MTRLSRSGWTTFKKPLPYSIIIIIEDLKSCPTHFVRESLHENLNNEKGLRN